MSTEVPGGGAPRLVRLYNVINGVLQLEAAGLGLIKPGHFISIPEAMLANQLVLQCMQQEWLVPEGHPKVVQARAVQHGAPVMRPGGQAEFAYQMPLPPGVHPQGMRLAGMVNRQGNPELVDSPVGVADANSIITGGRSFPEAQAMVPDADQVMRMGMRGQNTAVGQPGVPFNQGIPPMPQDPGIPLAGGILASQNPTQPQHNVIVGQPTGQPMQPGAFTQAPQPPMASSPVMPWAQPGQPVPGMPNAQFVGPNLPQYGIPQQRGAYPSFQAVQTPPQPSPIAPGGTMGQLIVPGSSYGQAGVMDIENAIVSAGRTDLFENTERVLNSVAQANREAGLVANYKEWTPQKRWDFIHRTQDLALLYKFYAMEIAAPEDRRSNQIILRLQQLIAAVNGQVPDVNLVRAMQIQQQTPQGSPQTTYGQILAEYPDWEDARKQAFVANLKDTELLGRLLKREINPANQQLIQSQIAQINELNRQAAVQRAQGQPTAIPPQEPPFLQGAVVDAKLSPPPPPAQQPVAPQPQFVPPAQQPVQYAPPQTAVPQAQFIPVAPQPAPAQPAQPQAQVIGVGESVFVPQPRPQG